MRGVKFADAIDLQVDYSVNCLNWCAKSTPAEQLTPQAYDFGTLGTSLINRFNTYVIL